MVSIGYYSKLKNLDIYVPKLLLQADWPKDIVLHVQCFLLSQDETSAFNVLLSRAEVKGFKFSFFNHVNSDFYRQVLPRSLIRPVDMLHIYHLCKCVEAIGIPTHCKSPKFLRLRWLVAEGPQQADFNKKRRNNVMDATLWVLSHFGCFMRYNRLVSINAHGAYIDDITIILCAAWHDVHDWLMPNLGDRRSYLLGCGLGAR